MYSIEDLEKDYQIYHSNFQIKNFISTKDSYNLWACYKQCLRELMKRVSIYRETLCNDKILSIKIKKIERKIENETDDLELDLLKVELVRNSLKVKDSKKNLKEVERELTQFWKHSQIFKTRLENEYGELTDEIKEELEQGMWEDKYKMQLAIDMRMYGEPRESLNLLSNFSIKQQQKLLLETPKEQAIEQYMSQKKIEISENDILKLDCNLKELALKDL